MKQLLGLPDRSVAELACNLVEVIAGDSVEMRDRFFHPSIVPEVAKLARGDSMPINVVCAATKALGSLCRGRPAPPSVFLRDAAAILVRNLASLEGGLICESLWALSNLTDGSELELKSFVVSQPEMVQKLLPCLQRDVNFSLPTLRTIGNLLGSPDAAAGFVAARFPELLVPFLRSPENKIRREAFFVLSNLVAGPAEHVNACVAAGISFVSGLRDSSPSVRFEAAWSLVYAVSGAGPHIALFCTSETVTELTNLFTAAEDLVWWSLHSVSLLLKAKLSLVDHPGLAEKIEAFMEHPSERVFSLAVKILKKFFDR